MPQDIAQEDLILISDSGSFYVVKMKATGGFHEPDRIEKLDPEFQTLPESLRAAGVEVADLPDRAVAAGCSCYLLNLQRLSGHGPATLASNVAFSIQSETKGKPRGKAVAKAKPAVAKKRSPRTGTGR